jgi:uncharacterized membrane protein YphA (DoxX/SURF4 family)
MHPQKLTEVAALILRVLLGVWFAHSGGEKLFVSGLAKFTEDVANYRMLSAPWDAVVAYTLPWFEIVAGLCLTLDVLRRAALVTIAGLVTVFSYGVGHAWSQGLNISCGCRGDGKPMDYTMKALEFALYFLVLAYLAWMERRQAVEGRNEPA